MIIRTMLLTFMIGALSACGGSTAFDSSDPNSSTAASTVSNAANSTASLLSSASSKASLLSSASSNASAISSKSSVTSTGSSASALSSSMASVSSSVTMSAASSLSPQSNPQATTHNAGTDCMSCHAAGKSAANFGVFTVAGTVYQKGGKLPLTVAKVRLKTTNATVALIDTDLSGNFYTTLPVQGLASGLQTQVEVGASFIKMSGAVFIGSCNSCHKPGGGAGGVIVGP